MTTHILTLAKWQAKQILKSRRRIGHMRFKCYAVRKYKCKPQQVTFDDKRAEQLIDNAVLYIDDPKYLGQTDNIQIRINAVRPLTYADIVGTLIHESMHNWCSVRGKYMSMQNEHHCMGMCGDPNE